MPVRREPEALIWTLHTAIGNERALPDADAWRTAIPALGSSRLLGLAGHLLGARKSSLPDRVRLTFEAADLEAEVIARRNRAQLDHLLAYLAQTDLRWVVLKSWPLAARLYPAPAYRPSGDLDLLVGQESWKWVVQALLSAGYERTQENETFHHRFLRRSADGYHDVIELHHSPNPREFGGPEAEEVLASRQMFQSEAGPVPIPSPDVERDLLVRHYLRHGGSQAILLLDLLLHLNGESFAHPLGNLITGDLARLDFKPTITGPETWRHQVLARWMAARTFAERRAARHVSVAGLPLALARSNGAALLALSRVVWPKYPTPRWRASNRSGFRRWTWRLHRLARLGRE
ncbi:MAG: nucleotidyltransferase family protein [Gemmatimonadota bacterium]